MECENDEVINNNSIKSHKIKILIFSLSSWILFSGCYKVVQQFSLTFYQKDFTTPFITEMLFKASVALPYFAWLGVLPALQVLKKRSDPEIFSKIRRFSKYYFYFSCSFFLFSFLILLVSVALL